MGRTSIILGGVALVLLGFIVFFEHGSVTTSEREGRKGRILESFVRDRVTRIEIQRKGVTTVLARNVQKSGDDFEGSVFRVEKPYAADADREAVEVLLGALEFITPKRSLGEASKEDLARFGLDKPRYRVTFVAGREQGSFSVGAQSEDGAGAYLQTGSDRHAYVVGLDVVEALDHEPVDYHTKALHQGVSAYATQKLRVRDAKGELAIERRDELYWLQGPEPALASEPQLSELVNALDSLKAARFVAHTPDKAANLDKYGLTSPRFFLAVDTKTFAAKDAKKGESALEHLELRVGGACAGHAGESYVRADQGPVMCASDADITKLQTPAADLRERRLLALDDGQIHGVDVRAGMRQLRVEETKDSHTYRVLENGKQRETGKVDDTALADWFKALRAAGADAFETDVAQSLGTPVATLRFERAAGKPAYEVLVGRTAGDRVAVSRAGEKTITWFKTDVLPLVAASAVRFRKPKLLDLDASAVTKLTLSGAGRTAEVVSKRGEEYVLDEPAQAAGVQAERPVIDEIARLVAKLEVVRFVADAPAPAHGLAQPTYVLKLDFGGLTPQNHQLRIGAPADDGRYAQLDSDSAVFIVSPALVRQLEAPWVSRSALAVPLESLGAFEVIHSARKLKVEPSDGGGFKFGAGAAADEKHSAQEFARGIATLRASKVLHYGKPAADEGLDKPVARVVVQLRADGAKAGAKDRTLLFGRAVSAEPGADIYARRSDLDVSFSVPRTALELLQ